MDGIKPQYTRRTLALNRSNHSPANPLASFDSGNPLKIPANTVNKTNATYIFLSFGGGAKKHLPISSIGSIPEPLTMPENNIISFSMACSLCALRVEQILLMDSKNGLSYPEYRVMGIKITLGTILMQIYLQEGLLYG